MRREYWAQRKQIRSGCLKGGCILHKGDPVCVPMCVIKKWPL